MHQEIAVIGENPLGAFVTFKAGRKVADGFELQVDLIANGLHLAIVVAGADNEMICERGNAGEIKNDDVFGLFLLRGPHSEQPMGCFIYGFRRYFRSFDLFYFFLPQRLSPKPYRTLRTRALRPRLLWAAAVFAVAISAQKPTSADLALEDPSVLRARLDVDKMRMLVENGTVPRSRLERAEQDLLDKQDEAVITRALFGRDVNIEQAAETVAAAERRLARRKKTVEEETKQLAAGIIALQDLNTAKDDVERAQKDVDWAVARGKLVKQVERMAAAEADLMSQLGSMSPIEARKLMEHYEGKGTFTADDRMRVDAAFQARFRHGLPVSADGGSEVHRSMGFDHRGRVDVAVNPDAPEGIWLRHYLTANRIPFYAFRAAIAHKATGAHVHMGPASTRWVTGKS